MTFTLLGRPGDPVGTSLFSGTAEDQARLASVSAEIARRRAEREAKAAPPAPKQDQSADPVVPHSRAAPRSRLRFVVLSEIRKDDGTVEANAGRVAESIARLKAAGVPSRRIAVVGASMDGIIAARVSAAIADPELTHVLIASLQRTTSEPVVVLHGRVLSIHDAADDRPMMPEEYFERSPNLAEARRLITQTGRCHGLLYAPHAAWHQPAVDWIRGPSHSTREV